MNHTERMAIAMKGYNDYKANNAYGFLTPGNTPRSFAPSESELDDDLDTLATLDDGQGDTELSLAFAKDNARKLANCTAFYQR